MKHFFRTWRILLIPALLTAGVLLLFVGVSQVHAQEPCLRGGDGNCVELHVDGPASGTSTARNLTGTSTTSSIKSLSNGTLIAAVAEHKESFDGNTSVTNLIRYEIFLYYSLDGGVNWVKANVQNKQYWYVDEHLPNQDGATTITADTPGIETGAGFLGYDVAITEANGKAEIFIAHTIACAKGVDHDDVVDFNDEIESGCLNNPGGSTNSLGGSVFFDAVEYDLANQTFLQKETTKALTMSGGNWTGFMPTDCSQSANIGLCYGAYQGADHPSITSTEESAGNVTVSVSYSAYRGSLCRWTGDYADRCWSQNKDDYVGSVNITQYVKDFWVRQVNYATATGAISAPGGEIASNKRIERFPPSGFGVIGSEAYVYFSDIVGILGNNLVNIYGLSEIDSNGEATQGLKYATYDAGAETWTPQALLDGATWTGGSLDSGAGEHVASAIYLQDTKQYIPSFSVVSAPANSVYDPHVATDHFDHSVVHIAAYVDRTNIGAQQSVVPVYIKMHFQTIGAADTVQGIFLADRSANDRMTTSADNKDIMPNVDAGGPTIGYHRYLVYVAVPGSEINDSSAVRAKSTNAYMTRISATQSGSADWSASLDSSWLDRHLSAGNVPIYSQITPAISTDTVDNGFASPHVVDYGMQQTSASSSQIQIYSNLFMPPMLVVHAKTDASQPCSLTNTCAVGFTGEQYTNGIRGWAWAETVGWLSLSCSNLQSCYRESYDASGNAWTSTVGGNYYGVRAVVNDDISSNTLIGNAWSERVGYVSFDREANVSPTNPCGNPPEGYELTPNMECVFLKEDLSAGETDVNIHFVNSAGSNLNTLKTGSFRIGSEVIYFSGYDSGNPLDLVGVERGSNLTNMIYKSIPRAHKAGDPVFWISADDATADTNNADDIYRGINSYDPTSFEVQGWARARAWADYQQTYCTGGIGAGNASPCDKEWGWIKLTGDWSTVHWGKFVSVGSCGTDQLKVSSIDGYPDPQPGLTEKLYLKTSTLPPTYIWEYSAVDRINKFFALTPPQLLPLPPPQIGCPANNSEVAWITQPTSNIDDTVTEIPVESTAGLLPSGKLLIREFTAAGVLTESEEIEYSSVDELTKTIKFITRGTPAVAFDISTSDVIIQQVNETGTYNTFLLPILDYAPEQTLAGFGWSAPNTETISADPNVSRYEDNLAGFGWVNFQPNQLELIYPYLRTLFNDVYVGGNLEILGPEYNINPAQYTATYQLETNGFIRPFISDEIGASSGQYFKCLKDYDESECATKFKPTTPVPEITVQDGASSVLGKLPDIDAMSDMVSDCLRWDSTGEHEVDCPTIQPRTLTNKTDIDVAPSMGKNKYGHDVILCRHDPAEALTDIHSSDVFLNQAAIDASSYFSGGSNAYEYNPPECNWQLSEGFTATLSEGYTAGDFICVDNIAGYIADSGTVTFGSETSEVTTTYTKDADSCSDGSVKLNILTQGTENVAVHTPVVEKDDVPFYTVQRSHRGVPTVYTLPDAYARTEKFFTFGQMPLQFTNAPEGESGAITFIIPSTIVYSDTPMRYCPQGLNLLPCKGKADVAYDLSNVDGSGSKITSTNQLASVAWIVDGSVANVDGLAFPNYYEEIKSYRVGAYIVLGDETSKAFIAGRYGDFMSHYLILTNLQFKLYGLVVARSFTLTGEYYVQDSSEVLIEPSEDFIYDGRAVVNPPPGLADLTTGLPIITQATP